MSQLQTHTRASERASSTHTAAHAVTKSHSCQNTRDVRSGERVDGLTLNVHEVLCKNRRGVVDGGTGTVEGSAEHLLGDGHLEDVAAELAAGFARIDSSSAAEHLHHSLVATHLQHLALALLAVAERERDDLGVLGELDVVEDDKRTVHTLHGTVVEARLQAVVAEGRRGIDGGTLVDSVGHCVRGGEHERRRDRKKTD